MNLSPELNAYWQAAHPSLAEGYYDPRYPGDRVLADCEEIAATVRGMLGEEQSHLLRIYHQGGIAFSPRPFPRLRWLEHVVCESDDVVFDPMLPGPLPRDHYMEQAFTEPLRTEEIVLVYPYEGRADS